MTRRIVGLLLLTVMMKLAHAGLALVGNENAGTVSLIDTASDEVVGEIKTGGKPRGAAILAARKLAYVSDQPANALLVIDLEKRAVTKKTDVSAEEDDKLEVIDVAARKLVAQIKVGTRPRGIAFTPDGAKAYVACERADTVYVLDARQHKILRTIKAGLRSNGLAMHPDGKRLYLTNGGAGNVMVIDTATDSVTATIPVGQRPWNMALTRDGAKLYVANGRSDSVSVIDTAKNVKIKDIRVGKTPWGVAIFE